MQTAKFDELAGRIEGLSWAVLQLTAALEMQSLIDGPRLSERWRGSLSPRNVDTPMRQEARTYLQTLATLLDEARSSRQSRAGQ